MGAKTKGNPVYGNLRLAVADRLRRIRDVFIR